MEIAAGATSAGPSVAVTGWIAWVIVAGAVAIAVTSLWTLWRKIVRPFVQSVDTLADIAVQFRPNHGTSLHDVIHVIRDDVKHVADVQQAMVHGADGDRRKLTELWDYSHQMKHDIVGALSAIALAEPLVQALVQELGKRPQRIDE